MIITPKISHKTAYTTTDTIHKAYKFSAKIKLKHGGFAGCIFLCGELTE